MMPRRQSRKRYRRLYQAIMITIVTMVVLSLALGTYSIPKQTESAAPGKPVSPNTPAADFGISYLPLTAGVAAYYGLGIDYGAMVTEIASNSLADRAGLRVGDVILSYNGADVEKGSSLLAAVRGCPAGSNVALEVWRGEVVHEFSFVHSRN